ncbi:hypothetical protein [Sulfurimonas sp.]
MELDTSTLMFIFFILLLIVSIWKIYAFLPNKQLADDDTTDEAQNELNAIMIKTIQNHNENISIDELFVYMVENENFNKEKYWRFNKNRLNKLLESYYIKNPHANCIADIYKETKV